MTPKKKPTNDLIGAVEADNPLISSLTALAQPVIQPKQTRTRTSRFWFQLETTEQFVKHKKVVLKPVPIEHIDKEVTDRVASYKEELSPTLQDKIVLIREFFLTQIAPITLAASGGSVQAREVAQRTLGIDIDSAMFVRFETMVNKAATLKLSKFVASIFNLPEDAAAALTGSGNTNPDSQLHSMMSELKSMNAVHTRKEVKALKEGMTRIERAVNEKGK